LSSTQKEAGGLIQECCDGHSLAEQSGDLRYPAFLSPLQDSGHCLIMHRAFVPTFSLFAKVLVWAIGREWSIGRFESAQNKIPNRTRRVLGR
jgi:hypothetical protein